MSPGLQPANISVEACMGLTFVHHDTHCVPVGAGVPVKAYGNTIWVAASEEGKCIAISFDWAAIERGVLVIADPFRISSNLWPVDELGSPLAESARFRTLNTLVWQMQWHSVVMEHIPEAVTHAWQPRALVA